MARCAPTAPSRSTRIDCTRLVVDLPAELGETPLDGRGERELTPVKDEERLRPNE
jgi:hypothetical protein